MGQSVAVTCDSWGAERASWEMACDREEPQEKTVVITSAAGRAGDMEGFGAVDRACRTCRLVGGRDRRAVAGEATTIEAVAMAAAAVLLILLPDFAIL